MSNQPVTQMVTLYAQVRKPHHLTESQTLSMQTLCLSYNSILRLRGASLHVTQVLVIFFFLPIV